MIGVSLPLDWLVSRETTEGDIFTLLAKLKSLGVQSIELRTVRPHHTPESVMDAMNLLWDNGFFLTVHGCIKSAETAVDDVFGPLSICLGQLRQKQLNVTIHPIAEGLEEALLALSDHILSKEYPITISLENNRLLPTKEEGDSVALVTEVVEKVNRKNIGICFDLGHFAYYVKKNRPQESALLPPAYFCKHITHTHIHAMKELRTHYPLGAHFLPLEAYLRSFSNGYTGVYNIELDFPRLKDEYKPTEALEIAIPYLKERLPHTARLYDRTRAELDKAFLSAVSHTEHAERGTVFSLIHSTSYLFNTNGYFWAMDIAFRNGYQLAETPSKAEDILKNLKLLILTHGHRDHFEEETLKRLAKNETQFIVPDFLTERALEIGIPETKIIVSKPDEPIHIGPFTVLPFESRHFRENGGEGVPEYGYHISAPDAPAMLFPGDIRDFALENRPVVPPADILFAHLWLGDESVKEEQWHKRLLPWACFMLAFSPKKILITHLYENGRPDHRMWRIEHALEAKNALLSLCPNADIVIPDWGDGLKF